MMKSILLMIAVLGYVSAESNETSSTPAPENPESSVPKIWTLKKDFISGDLNKDFDPPQPWVMIPVEEESNDVNLTNTIQIRVPNDFTANAINRIFACGYAGSYHRFYLKNLEGNTSVFTYPSKTTNSSDDPMLWEVDTSKRITGFEMGEPISYEFSIRPANYTVQEN